MASRIPFLAVLALLVAPALAGCIGPSPAAASRDLLPARVVVVLSPDAPAPRTPGPAGGAPAAWDAVQMEHYLPVDVSTVAPSQLAATLSDRPTALVVEEIASLPAAMAVPLADYVRSGGILLVLGVSGDLATGPLAQPALLAALGLQRLDAFPARTITDQDHVAFPSPWWGLAGDEPLLYDWVRSAPLGPGLSAVPVLGSASALAHLGLPAAGATVPLLTKNAFGAGTAWFESVDLGRVAWRYHLGRAADFADGTTWSGWSHLHGLQWLLLRNALVDSLPKPLPVLSPAPNGFHAILNYQLDFEGGFNVTDYAPDAQGRDAQARIALERAQQVWGPGLFGAAPWLDGHLESAIPLGIVCAENGTTVYPNAQRLLAWTQAHGPTIAEGFANNIMTGSSALDFEHAAGCVQTLRSLGLAAAKDPWPAWCQFRSQPPNESYVQPWVERGLLATVDFCGERTSTSFLPVPVSTSLATALAPPAYLVPEAYMTGFEELRPRSDVDLLAWDAAGLAPHLGWVRDDRQVDGLAGDIDGLTHRALPLVQRGEAWFADARSIARWLTVHDAVHVHGYRLRPDHVEAQLTAPQGADGVTLQLLGLQPGQGVEAVTIDGVPSTYLAYPDRVVLAGWSNGTHTVDVRLGPGHASASHEPILGMDGGLTRDASAPSGVSDHAPRLAAAVVAKDESASPTGPSAPRGAAESTSR